MVVRYVIGFDLIVGGINGLVALEVHGVDDGAVLLATVDGSEAYAGGGYTRVDMDGVGHFPQREVPMQVAAALLAFLGDVWAQ